MRKVAVGLLVLSWIGLAGCGGGGPDDVQRNFALMSRSATAAGDYSPAAWDSALPSAWSEPERASPVELAGSASAAAKHAPIVYRDGWDGTTVHVGAEPRASRWSLPAEGVKDGVEISAGTMTDYALTRDKAASYLYQMVDIGLRQNGLTVFLENDSGLSTFPDAPVVRITQGTSEVWKGRIVTAVQAVNAYMPKDKRIRIDPSPAPKLPLMTYPDGSIFYRSDGTTIPDVTLIPDGQIFVAVGDADGSFGWSLPNKNYKAGKLNEVSRMRANLVTIDHDMNSGYFAWGAMGTLLHELLHAVGCPGMWRSASSTTRSSSLPSQERSCSCRP